jgi:hypothetical protein
MTDRLTVATPERKATSPRKPTAAELLAQGSGFFKRGHLRDLGLERGAIDAAFAHCPVIALPDYSIPMIRVEAFIAFMEGNTYCDRCADRVRPPRA